MYQLNSILQQHKQGEQFMFRNNKSLPSLALVALAFASIPLQAQQPAANSPVEPDGTVHVKGFDLYPSIYLSPEARKSMHDSLVRDLPQPALEAKAGEAAPAPAHEPTPAEMRAGFHQALTPAVETMHQLYPFTAKAETVAGVHAYRVEPKSQIAGEKRILINLHAGGFFVGDAETTGEVESAPIASLTGIPVITLDYRMAPEYQFPAASEDVTAVYRELLKSHKPEEIGIYGCSAGGQLTAEATAWIAKEKLPRPGAIGIFCASADGRWQGDSFYTEKPLAAQPARTPTWNEYDEKAYYGKTPMTDPLLSPVLDTKLLAAFPPTLFIAGSRGGEFSSAAHSNIELAKLGIETEFYVWDGLGHAFFLDPSLPESKEVYQLAARFFSKHLRK